MAYFSSSSSNPVLFSTLSLVCFFFFFSENKSFVSATRSEEASNELQHNTHSRVSLSSLFPSSSCSSPPQGANRNGSLEVVHKHGPCSKLKQPSSSSSPSSFIIQHSEILKQDEARVRAIQYELSKTHQNHHQEQVETSTKGSDGTQLPAKSAIPLLGGNYYVTVGLGSPKRDLSLVFDTGSDLTWTQCKPCARSCYSQKEPIFDPSQSSSYSNISCSSSQCSQLVSATGIRSACSKATRACLYGVQYGDGSFSIGFFAKEKLTVSSTDVFDNFFFGCGQNNGGLFRGIAGLLGLGRSLVSIVEQTAQKYRKIFSYCLPSTLNTVGYLNFGGVSSNTNIKYIPFSSNFRNSSFYVLDLIGIAFGGANLPIAASVFSRGTVVDSGTVITRLPPAAYSPLSDAFQKFMSARYPKGDSDDLLGTCYDLSGYKSFSVPSISLLFKGGVNVELAGIGVVYIASQKQVCLGFAANKKDGDVAIIGNTQQKTLEIVYDVGGERIGFRPLGCN
ncbi:hypothetical protein QN277_018503 [Acacia crassicarpa]|uniref:Peptidase A1 domain-containing protein n=1 Tax=Acacia crassicarpa TaxID=499986 RepID=A0AAE1JVZ4_9FABA|nr:hypothetical protein QN277_018503 [Acacia crassicarpa]